MPGDVEGPTRWRAGVKRLELTRQLVQRSHFLAECERDGDALPVIELVAGYHQSGSISPVRESYLERTPGIGKT